MFRLKGEATPEHYFDIAAICQGLPLDNQTGFVRLVANVLQFSDVINLTLNGGTPPP